MVSREEGLFPRGQDRSNISDKDLFPSRYNSNDVPIYASSSESQISEFNETKLDNEDLDSINSSIIPQKINSQTIKKILLNSDKDKLKTELNGLNDRYFFTNLFKKVVNLDDVDNNQMNDFIRYDHQLKVENFLRQKTKKFLLENPLNKTYTIEFKHGELDDGQYVAGNDLNFNNSNFKFLNKFQNKLKLRESSSIELNNFKSLETNIIDYEMNYNIPIDNQNYNSIMLKRSEKVNFTEFENIEAIDSIESQRLHEQQRRKKNHEIQRKLNTRHLTMIAFGGTLGVGLFLASGKLFSIAGPLGALLGFLIAGSTVLATMLSFCEMVTLIPLAGGVSGISSRFVEDAFGFALGIIYWGNYMIGLPTEITALTIMLSYYDNLQIPGKSTPGFVTLFLFIVIGINLCDIRVYGEIEYVSSLIKLILLFALIIFNIVLNRGGVPPYHNHIGFKYWDTARSDFTNQITYGPFRPTFDLKDVGLGAMDGIEGNKGRFLLVLIAAVVALYCFIGTEILLIAGGELKNPRKLIPKSSKLIYWRILLFYVVGIFVIGLNIYSGDPRLLRYYTTSDQQSADESVLIDKVITANGGTVCNAKLLEWAGFANGNQSPWVIALQSAGLCGFASTFNGFLVFFALSAGSSQLYASSRTLYYMSIQGKWPKIFSRCSRNGVPYVSVLFSGSFGALLYLTVNNNTASVFEKFLSICSSFGLVVWGGMNLSFIRFYYGLKMRPDITDRNDQTYPYRSPFQPYLSYFGLFSSIFLVVVNGVIVFLKGNWSVTLFFTSYGSVMLLILCYIVYKIFRRTKIHRLDQLDLDSGRREIDRIIWEDNREYHYSFKERLKKSLLF